MPLEPALAFVVDTLRGCGLRGEIRVLASGKIIAGVTTHDPALTRGLVVEDKARRVASYQHGVLRATLELLAAMGLRDVRELRRHHIRKRTTPERTQRFEELYPSVRVGSAL